MWDGNTLLKSGAMLILCTHIASGKTRPYRRHGVYVASFVRSVWVATAKLSTTFERAPCLVDATSRAVLAAVVQSCGNHCSFDGEPVLESSQFGRLSLSHKYLTILYTKSFIHGAKDLQKDKSMIRTFQKSKPLRFKRIKLHERPFTSYRLFTNVLI